MNPTFEEILSDTATLRAEAKAKADPEWWAKYGEKSFDAALGLFGISDDDEND